MARRFLNALVILFVLGALGCGGTIESDDSALDYNRLQPMSMVTAGSELAQFLPEGTVFIPSPEDQMGGCWVTGIGHIGADTNGNGISDKPGAGAANQDSYGGNAMGMKDGTVRGEWQNTTHLADGNHKFHGQAEFLYCWNDGGPGPDVPKAIPNRAIWGGPGQWDHQDGYLFIVSAADYKEGKNKGDAAIRDAYAITVYRDLDGDHVATAKDQVVYSETDCVFGNFQIHPPNQGHPYVPSKMTAEMDRISSTQDLCPNANW